MAEYKCNCAKLEAKGGIQAKKEQIIELSQEQIDGSACLREAIKCRSLVRVNIDLNAPVVESAKEEIVIDRHTSATSIASAPEAATASPNTEDRPSYKRKK